MPTETIAASIYDPLTSRFLSTDLLGHAASPNLYSFCNDPVNFFDPDGRCGYSGSYNIYFGLTLQDRLDKIWKRYDQEVYQNEIQYFDTRIAQINNDIKDNLDFYNKINLLYMDATIDNYWSGAVTTSMLAYNFISALKEIGVITAETTLERIPGLASETTIQGAIPLKYGGGIVVAGTESTTLANSMLAADRAIGYTLTAGQILAKEVAKDQAQAYAENKVSLIKMMLDPFGAMADANIAIADKESLATQARINQLTAQKIQLLMQQRQLNQQKQ